MTVETETFDLEAFDNELKAFDADFVELSNAEGEVTTEDDEILGQLDQEFSAAGLSGGLEASSLSALAENEVEVAFVVGFIRRKVRRLFRILYRYARRYVRCKSCLRELLSAIAAYKKGRVFTALHRSYKTYRCYRRCAAR